MSFREEFGSFDLARFTLIGWLVFLMSIGAGLTGGISVGFACIAAGVPQGFATKVGGVLVFAGSIAWFFALKSLFDAFGVVVILPKSPTDSC